MSERKKIYISSYTSPQASDVKSKLIDLYNSSDKTHVLTRDPSKAEIILIGQPGNELKRDDYFEELTEHKLISKYTDKVFSVSFFRDKHFFLTRGIYESAVKSILLKNRVRSGCFVSESFNPVIRKSVLDNRELNKRSKDYLFSFVGRKSHKIRAKIFSMNFSRPDVHIEDSSCFNAWDENVSDDNWRFQHYKEVLLKSKFSLCPRGWGPGSIRLFESMSLGISPIIISDEWKFPKGPNWDDFSIIIQEKDIESLESIVNSYENNYEEMGKKAKQVYELYFSENNYFNYIVNECIEIEDSNLLPEKFHWGLKGLYLKYFLFLDKIRKCRNYFYRNIISLINEIR